MDLGVDKGAMRATAASVHLGVTALLGVAVLAAQVSPARNVQEFPNYDAGVLTLLNTGVEQKRARRALAEAPDAPETARLLASQNRIERTGDDPTPRFARVMEVVRELTSGRYPPSESVDRAPQLLSGFSLYRPKFASVENVEAMLATYREVVARDMERDPANLPGSSLDYLITGKMGDLHALAGRDRIAGVEQELATFERLSPTPGAVRLLRAQFYFRNLVEIPAQRDSLIAKVRSTLDTLAADTAEPFARRALATLAALHFHERQYAGAIPLYQRYLAKYPTSEWAWVAMLRLGQSQEAGGDATTAATTFEALAARSGTENFIRVIGHSYAAEALASLGQVGAAARQAERALALWDDDYGAVYRSQGRQALLPGQQVFDIRGDGDISKASLPARIEELRQAASVPGGDALERGRALIRKSRFADARALLERAAADARGTPLAPAAIELAHRARLEHALSLASLDNAKRDAAAAIVELEALSDETVSFPAIAAQITRATMRATGGGAEDADSLMTSALNTWRTQQPTSPAPPSGSLEADLAAIRSVVFAPLGGGVYIKGRWNAFDFPSTLPSFLIVNPSMQVILNDGAVQRVSLRRPIAGFSNVLYLDDEQLDLMDRMIRSLGGTGRRQPTQIMETPNQPVGRAVDVRAYWNRFFPMRQGHWFGWVFQTYPIIRDVTFQNAQRTRAAVRVEVGYSGGTVVLEKQQGVWRAIDIVNMWVT